MKFKKSIKLLFFLLILSFVIYKGINLYNSIDNSISKETKVLMQDNNINKDDYSKTLEYVLLNNIYDDAYLNEYKNIEFVDKPNFQEIITVFLPKGYSGKEINYLIALSNKNIEYLKDTEHMDISKYYMFKNFDAAKIARYNAYFLENDYPLKDVVTYVNIGIDLKAYSETKEVDDPNSLNVLVNKYNYLPNGYAPSDLIYLDGAYGNKVPVRNILKEDFLKLQKAAKEEININLMPTTAYRNFSFQATLYNNYVASDGKEKADTYSARPGYSEHQTGLAIDLRNTDLPSNIRLTDENFEWLYNNAYKYGFIIRFPKDKEYITCYQFENWHIRYVGKDVAKVIYDNKLTLEEYIDLYITEY